MESQPNIITCPKCGNEINVSDVLFNQIEERLKQDFQVQIALKDKEYQEKDKVIQQAQNEVQKAKEDMQTQVDAAVKQQLSLQKTAMEKTLRKQVEDEKSEQMTTMEAELKKKSDQLKDFNKTKADLARLQREKDEMKEQLEAENEQKLNERITEEREKIKTAEADKSKTEVQKRDKIISDLTKRLDEAQTKLEQGSNKLAGEVKEIELRDFLKATFPIDSIEDVPSGLKGADVMQIVKNNIGQPSGTILFERKQTLAFSDGWVAKLKEDGRTSKSDVLVLVTQSLPKNNQNTHFRDGVWVCSFDDLLLLITLLRDGLIKQSAALVSQQNKGSKMEMLYDYLLSNDFVNHITGIIDAFKKMDQSIQKEKSDAMKRFAERESHVWQAKKSVLSFWGRVEGIAADGLSKQVKMLDEGAEQGKLEE
jgi:hypothetical protein